MEHRVIYTRLPYDSEIEYLQSSNTQWIDTLYKMKLYDEIRFKVQCLNDYNCVIFGSRGTINTNFYQLYIDSTVWGLSFGQHNASTIYTQINSFQNNGVNEITIKDGLCICNGVNTSIPLGTENSAQKLAIFARRNSDNTISYPIKMKLYYFKIYSNNVLVRDFIPVRKGSIGYLYDKVSRKLFANKGTGNFILGQDVANNIRRVFRFNNKRFIIPMPYDSKIEYLESPSGNAYINTLIPANKISEFTVRIAPTTVPNTFYAIGADNGGDTRFSIGYSSVGAGYVQIRLGEYYNGIIYTLEQFDTITLNRLTGKYYVNGTEYTGKIVTNSKTNPNSFILFRARTSGTTLSSNKNTTRIASFSAKGLNGELVLDLIPIRRGNVGYMYDRVSGKLFGNSGTGQFILGNDIND